MLDPTRRDSDRLRGRNLLLVLLLAGAQFILVLDVTIVSVALPQIQRGLAFSRAELQWVVVTYALSFGGFLVLGGRAGDLYGHRRIFLASVIAFTCSSLVAGLALSRPMLIGARAAQGLAAAGMAPAALALLTTNFRSDPQRTRALAINGSLIGSGFAVGALLGGVMTTLLGWRAVLLASVPPGLLMAALTVVVPRERRYTTGTTALNGTGALLASGGVMSLIYAIGSLNGRTPGMLLVSVGVSALLICGFLTNEAHSTRPLIPGRLRANRSVAAGSAVLLLATGTDGGLVYLMPLYLQRALGYTPLETGLVFLAPGATAIGAGALVARFATRWGLRRTLLGGLIVEGAGLLVLLCTPARGLPVLLVGNALDAFGTVVAIVACTIAITKSAPVEDQGVVGGVLNSAIQLGTGLGIAVMVASAASTPVSVGPLARTPVEQATSSLHRAMAAGSVMILLALTFAAGRYFRETPRRPASQRGGQVKVPPA